jgi:hypothetical protein
MSADMWPNNTAWLPPDGTHRVEKRNVNPPKSQLFLRAPKSPIELPFWTTIESEAGIWSERDAKFLAGFHSGVGTSDGEIVEARAEPSV